MHKKYKFILKTSTDKALIEKQIFAMKGFQKQAAFSLVELLMALLVASLLMAALAPVMTKKFGENVIVSGTGGVRGDYSRTFYEDFEWTVPNGVNTINVTAIGGGGAGGGASYGYKEITSSESNWTVPDGVTKLRVFMTGAGGGGASGGQIKNWLYNDIPEVNNADASITTAGTYTFENNIVLPDTYKAPVLHNYCAASGTTSWIIASNNSNINPNTKFTKIDSNNTNITITKATACGAGGGNSNKITASGQFESATTYMSYGGSGGYLVNQAVNYTAKPNAITFKVGAPGGRGTGAHWSNPNMNCTGGIGGTGGSNGSNGVGCSSHSDSNYQAVGGAGGGGSTAILNSANNIIFEAPGGGGAGGGVEICNNGWANAGYGGPGGGTFNQYRGWGGNGAGTIASNGGYTAIAGGGSSSYVAGKDGIAVGTVCQTATGGGGGGGIGGIGGGNGNLNSIFSVNNCNSEKPGAIKVWYNIPKITNGLKCQYKDKSNSGAGGGAGQIWIGEIDVVPGQKINFNIGLGGERKTTYSANGNDGENTSIVINGSTIATVSGGKGGKYESDDTYLSDSGGLGGRLKTSNFSSTVIYKNWMNIANINSTNSGLNGSQGNTASSGGGGGKGGNTISKDGIILNGASSVNAQTNGLDAPTLSYGAGGGGGGGVINYGSNPGTGGKGANGYIYIEWGNSNGGGGSSGQVVVKRNIWVSAGTKIKINVGKGGEAKPIVNMINGVSGYFGEQGNNGGDSFIVTSEGEAIRAKGGIGGYPGTSVHGKGGNSEGSTTPDNILSNSIAGSDGDDDYGGIGGSIDESICPLIDSLTGLGGCGGNMPNGNCANSSSTPIGKNGSKVGGGGGGGAVKDNAAYTGGKGANGMVTIDWTN